MNLVNFRGGYPICIIQNTDLIKDAGKHWVAYFIESPTSWEFFDSYGELPSLYKLSTPPGEMIEYNPKVLQSGHSTLCGHFSLHFLYYRSIGINFFTYKKYKEMFEPRKDLESIIRKFYANLVILPSNISIVKCQCCVRRGDTSYLLEKYYPNTYKYYLNKFGL